MASNAPIKGREPLLTYTSSPTTVSRRDGATSKAIVESGKTSSTATMLYEKWLQLKTLGYYTDVEVGKSNSEVASLSMMYDDKEDERQFKLHEAQLVRRFFTPTPAEVESHKAAATKGSAPRERAQNGQSASCGVDEADIGSPVANGMSTALEVARASGYKCEPGKLAKFMGVQEMDVKCQLLAQYAGHEKARREAELQALKAMYDERRRERRARLAALELKLRDCPEARPDEFWRVWEEFQEDKKRQEVETAAQLTNDIAERH